MSTVLIYALTTPDHRAWDWDTREAFKEWVIAQDALLVFCCEDYFTFGLSDQRAGYGSTTSEKGDKTRNKKIKLHQWWMPKWGARREADGTFWTPKFQAGYDEIFKLQEGQDKSGKWHYAEAIVSRYKTLLLWQWQPGTHIERIIQAFEARGHTVTLRTWTPPVQAEADYELPKAA